MVEKKAHPNRCRKCRFAPGETGSHWCYRNPPANGGYRQWIDQSTYDDFIALLGCASFEPMELDQRQTMLELKKDFDKPIPDELVEELDLFSREWAASSYQDMCFGHSSTRRQGEEDVTKLG
jgi:hypothetical protein